MKKQFVTYEIAKELKELGFDEPCFGYFKKSMITENQYNLKYKQDGSDNYFFGNTLFSNKFLDLHLTDCFSAPLWQQAIDFLLEKHLTHISIRSEKWASVFVGEIEDENSLYITKEFNNTEDTRKESILYAIKIIKDKNK